MVLYILYLNNTGIKKKDFSMVNRAMNIWILANIWYTLDFLLKIVDKFKDQ